MTNDKMGKLQDQDLEKASGGVGLERTDRFVASATTNYQGRILCMSPAIDELICVVCIHSGTSRCQNHYFLP